MQKRNATEAARFGWRKPGAGVRMQMGVGEGTPPNSAFRTPLTLPRRIPLRSDGPAPLDESGG